MSFRDDSVVVDEIGVTRLSEDDDVYACSMLLTVKGDSANYRAAMISRRPVSDIKRKFVDLMICP